jgi:hypothetical protein
MTLRHGATLCVMPIRKRYAVQSRGNGATPCHILVALSSNRIGAAFKWELVGDIPPVACEDDNRGFT